MALNQPNGCKMEYMNPPRNYVALSSVVTGVTVKSGAQLDGIYVTERKNVGTCPHDKGLDPLGVQLWTFDDIVRTESDSGCYNDLDKVFLWDGKGTRSVDQMQADRDIRACHQHLLRFGVGGIKLTEAVKPKDDPGWDVVAERVMLQQALMTRPFTPPASHTWPSPVIRNRGTGALYVIGHTGSLMRYDGDLPVGGA